MIHLVPAWYNPQRRWYSTDSTWFAGATNTEPDDIATQARVFRQGDEESGLVVLNYSPSLRRSLHRQDLVDVPYWSFFDELQGLEDDYTRPLDFLELEWPEDASFFYNPFLVTVMQGDDVYARVYLAREGTLQSVRFYGAGMPMVERVFDDRGFLSSVLMHDAEGAAVTQYYLSREGDVVVSEDIATGRIDVVQNEGRFEQDAYDGWEPLMAELLRKYLARTGGPNDTVVLALAEQHNALVASVLTDETLVLSRAATRPSDAAPALIERAGAVFTDVGQADKDRAQPPSDAWMYLPVLSVYPLERRPDFGASANEATNFISLFVDNIPLEDLDQAIALMAGQLVADDARLLVCTFRSQDLDYLADLRRVIAGYQSFDLSFLADDELAGLSIDVGIADAPEEKIQLTFLDREAEMLRTIAKTRVLVDLGETVNYRLATEAVNAGVPQVNRYEQELVTHPLNGYVIADVGELPVALAHFLDGLEHWNQSLVQCRVLQDLFRPAEVLGRWELVKGAVA